jgi:1-acyl-sn-glycerol-3-phosphate acyltransferase
LSAIAPNFSYRFSWFDWLCLWYPPGWLILFNRHWQHYKPDPQGWNGLEFGLFLIPGGFYLAFAIRWMRLGGRSPDRPAFEPDATYQQAFRQEILMPILQRYFRSTLERSDRLPSHAPVLIAMNHAGMCFPWDFMGLGWHLSQARDWFVQPLAHTLFFDHPWLVWWLPQGWAQVLGGVRAERSSLEAAIADKTTLLYAPEGWRGLAKGWQHRYQLATFDPNFVKLSIQHHVPILPVICLGSENLHPFTVNVRRISRWLKLPLFPVSPLMVAFLLFPSMGVWAARSRLRYLVQPLWLPWQESEVIGTELPDRATLYLLANRLRSRLQTEINQQRNLTRQQPKSLD